MTIRAFGHAFRGLSDVLRTQRNARFHAVAAGVVVLTGGLLGLSPVEWALVALCIALVGALEVVNTAIEYLTDLACPHHHPLAGKAKDAAAGAVFLGAWGAAVVGGIIFGPKFAALLGLF